MAWFDGGSPAYAAIHSKGLGPIRLLVGQTKQLGAVQRNASHGNLGGAITFAGDNNPVATCSVGGLVAAVAPGLMTVTASDGTRTETIQVIVTGA